MATDTADTTEQQVPVTERALALLNDRLAEIRKFRDEANEIEQMLANLKNNTNGASAAPAKPAARKPAEPSAPPVESSPTAANDLKGRPLALYNIIKDNPGIKIAEAAKKMGLDQPNYAYRVKNGLAKDGLIRKEGDGFVVV